MKKTSLICLLLILSLALTACGGKKEESIEPSAAPSATEAPAVTAAPTEAPTATPVPTATPAPTEVPTATPAPTPTPVPQPDIVITKHPATDPAMIEGNTAIFSAAASNAALTHWQIAPADESRFYTDKEIEQAFTVTFYNVDANTCWIAGVPLAMNGYKVRAVFENQSGTAYSDWAKIQVSSFFALIAGKYTFSSGAGAWNTELTVNNDGSFNGYYHDSEAIGPAGQNGYLYECTFHGQFGQVGRIDNNVYTMVLKNIWQDTAKGTVYVDNDGLTHEITAPYGFDNASLFHVYMPDTPASALSPDFRIWAPAAPADGNYGSYGLFNYYGKQGFVK